MIIRIAGNQRRCGLHFIVRNGNDQRVLAGLVAHVGVSSLSQQELEKGGGIGIFPASGKGQVLDCGRALAIGYKCSLTKDSGYAALTEDLRKFNQKTCVVSNARVSGKTTKGTILIEVACSDGYKGYMIEYNTTPTVTAVGATGCGFAGGCKLPGNV